MALAVTPQEISASVCAAESRALCGAYDSLGFQSCRRSLLFQAKWVSIDFHGWLISFSISGLDLTQAWFLTSWLWESLAPLRRPITNYAGRLFFFHPGSFSAFPFNSWNKCVSPGMTEHNALPPSAPPLHLHSPSPLVPHRLQSLLHPLTGAGSVWEWCADLSGKDYFPINKSNMEVCGSPAHSVPAAVHQHLSQPKTDDRVTGQARASEATG